MNIPKILIPTKSVVNSNWNKHLPNPLKENEKCILDSNQEDVNGNYVRIKHGKNKNESIFHIRNFTDLKGKRIK